jgi:hypothetical protein
MDSEVSWDGAIDLATISLSTEEVSLHVGLEVLMKDDDNNFLDCW